jgi:hypothetical protein
MSSVPGLPHRIFAWVPTHTDIIQRARAPPQQDDCAVIPSWLVLENKASRQSGAKSACPMMGSAPSAKKAFAPESVVSRHSRKRLVPDSFRRANHTLLQQAELIGWGGRIRTSVWRNQNPLPYRLATPQCAARLAKPGGKRADNSSGSFPSQWPARTILPRAVTRRRRPRLATAPRDPRWRRRRGRRRALPVQADRRGWRWRRRPPRRRARR